MKPPLGRSLREIADPTEQGSAPATKVLVGLGVLAVVFGLLRIYGAYQNEQRKALSMVSQATEAFESEDFQRRLSHIKVGLYKISSVDAGIDAGHTLPADAWVPFSEYQHHTTASAILWTIASAEKRYASDRKTQTLYLLHKVWAKLTGASPETPEEWVRFLFQSYPGLTSDYRKKAAEYGEEKHTPAGETLEEWIRSLIEKYPAIGR